jgi:hypothetical protein
VSILLLLTMVLSGVGIPRGCEQKAAVLDGWVDSHARTIGRPLTVYVVSPEAAADSRDVAWTWPSRRPREMWFRLDFLCTSSDSAIELTVSHESFHLVNPQLSHEEIENALRLSVGPKAYAEHRAELDSAITRMEEWRSALMSRSRLYEPRRYGRQRVALPYVRTE